ncbi:MAG: hypothetical protein H7061_01285 [Bdellovibrionaceae bacterium]|nr:hypothetical protein [Bdellovibrio sp.]
MKKILSIAIVLAAATGFAQTSTTATSSGASDANTNSSTNESTQPASTTKATASPVTTIGTSTASAEQKPAETKNWSVSLTLQGEANNEQIQRIGEQTIGTVNNIGAGYKVTKDTKIGFRQYFNYAVGRESKGEIVSSFPVLTVGTKVAGIAGSDPIAPLFWYYIPTQEAKQNQISKVTPLDHNGILRMDAEVVWTVNPKVSLSYYFNPRQSLVPVAQNYIDNSGKPQVLESTTRLIHYVVAYYNVNDAIQPYIYTGMENGAQTETLTSKREHALTAVGVNFTMFGGKLIINPEIYDTTILKEKGEYAAAPRWLQTENLAYQLTTAMSF